MYFADIPLNDTPTFVVRSHVADNDEYVCLGFLEDAQPPCFLHHIFNILYMQTFICSIEIEEHAESRDLHFVDLSHESGIARSEGDGIGVCVVDTGQ